MEASWLDRVRTNVAWQIVEITWAERDWLLKKIATVSGFEKTVAKFEAVGASRPVLLGENELTLLRAPLEFWAQSGELSDGLARLLAAIVEAHPDAGLR